ncbi:hypothetical protein K449DRAFT_188077 [Hypoxylon sp. EC38]|nr:hypothetical protein K449DRAFT_188077 [Hypoxylon sp. EC38]
MWKGDEDIWNYSELRYGSESSRKEIKTDEKQVDTCLSIGLTFVNNQYIIAFLYIFCLIISMYLISTDPSHPSLS